MAAVLKEGRLMVSTSNGETCLSGHAFDHVHAERRRLSVVRRVGGLVAPHDRLMVPVAVRIIGTQFHDCLADVITGTLYDERSGRCLSTHQLHIVR